MGLRPLISVDIVANRTSAKYRIPMVIGESVFGIKYDTGAKYTVISASVFNSELTESDLIKIKDYCNDHGHHKERFISASGHYFDGYLVTAHDVTIGNTEFKEFHYFLITENERDIALLGFDFIDNCRDSHDPHGSIKITEFDEAGYKDMTAEGINNDEIIAYIDSLTLG